MHTPSNLVNELLVGNPVSVHLTRLNRAAVDGSVNLCRLSATKPTVRIRRRLGTIPAGRHLEVIVMLDSGLDLAHELRDGQLITTLATR